MRSNAGMANRQGDVDLRFAQVSAPVRTLAWLGWLGLNHLSFYPGMSARKRRSTTMDVESSSSEPKRGKTPELDVYLNTICINPIFDSNRVLRRVFFIDPAKTKYISVGFYPSRNYQPLFEIGSPNSNPLILMDLHVKTMAVNLPAQCDALFTDEFYKVLDGDLRMSTSSIYKTAVISLGSKKRNKKSMYFKLHELRYLSYIFFIVQNQLIKYTEAIAVAMNYDLSSLSSMM